MTIQLCSLLLHELNIVAYNPNSVPVVVVFFGTTRKQKVQCGLFIWWLLLLWKNMVEVDVTPVVRIQPIIVYFDCPESVPDIFVSCHYCTTLLSFVLRVWRSISWGWSRLHYQLSYTTGNFQINYYWLNQSWSKIVSCNQAIAYFVISKKEFTWGIPFWFSSLQRSSVGSSEFFSLQNLFWIISM